MSGSYEFVKRKTPPENPRTPWIEKICCICNEKFFVTQAKASAHVTCGSVCSKSRRAQSWEVITCKQCGNLKKVRKIETAKFCSFLCSRKFLSGKNHANWIFQRKRKCLNCNRTFSSFSFNSHVDREVTSEKKYCSRDCASAFQMNKRPHSRNLCVGAISQYADGYRRVKLLDGSWIPEHRYVMEQLLGRPLTQDEIVHHRDGVPSNNSPDNLLLTDKVEHQQIHYQAEQVGLREMWVHPLEGIEV